MFTKIETDLRRRLQETQDRLAQAEEGGMKLRQVHLWKNTACLRNTLDVLGAMGGGVGQSRFTGFVSPAQKNFLCKGCSA